MSALVAGLFCAVGGTLAVLVGGRQMRRSKDLLAAAVARHIATEEAIRKFDNALTAVEEAQRLRTEMLDAMEAKVREESAALVLCVSWGIAKRERTNA